MYAGVSLDQAPPEDIPVRFFLSAPAYGIIAGLLIAIRGEDLFLSIWGSETIALTHLFTLGWLAMIMMGAFYQMVPVLVGGTVPFIRASRVVHSLFSLGVVLIVSGMYLAKEPFIIAGAAALAPSLLFFIVQISIALLKVKADRPTVVAMRISVTSFLITILLGIYFAGTHAFLWEMSDNRMGLTGTHMVTGLFGWVGGLIMGVGFHVIPMFYMTPEFPKKKASLILRLYGTSLLLLPLALLTNLGSLFYLGAAIPGLAALTLFGVETFALMGKRRRKIKDTTLKAWQRGLIILPPALIALIVTLFVDTEIPRFLFGHLFIVGFGLTVTTGMLYKILPFLVWFHRFSFLIGKVKVPLMKDICSDKKADRQLLLFLTSVVILFFGIASNFDIIIRAGGLVFFLSSAMLLLILVKMIRMKAPEVPQEKAQGMSL
ncbi:MAG: hypothetical protein OEV42_09140 [Deltaproteobacteria bacterium]|nr:hypothetical protein [Deltaproteobacteria bacterium]